MNIKLFITIVVIVIILSLLIWFVIHQIIDNNNHESSSNTLYSNESSSNTLYSNESSSNTFSTRNELTNSEIHNSSFTDDNTCIGEKQNSVCLAVMEPVLGCDNEVYSNKCVAANHGIKFVTSISLEEAKAIHNSNTK